MNRKTRSGKEERKFLKSSCRLTEKGSILMVTLMMILLATIVGFIGLKTATTGISLAGNYKSGMQAFYTADSLTKYVIANPISFNMTSYLVPLASQGIPDPGLPGSSILATIFPATTSNLNSTVTYLQTGIPPAGTSSRYFQTNYFVLNTTVKGTNNAQEVHEILYASTVPKVCGQSC
jgi:hypothetical protein